MPTRGTYVFDVDYATRHDRTLGALPKGPAIEIYLPDSAPSELKTKIMKPVWEYEAAVVWTLMAETLSRDGVRGDLLEFGVYTGFSLSRHVEIFRPHGIIRRFYGFDSFKGLPKFEDGNDIPGWWYEGQFSDTSKEKVEAYLASYLGRLDDVELVEGWFSETLAAKAQEIQRIAFIRVDCDLYDSTVDVFRFAEGRLEDGAILYFDDWTHEVNGETKAFFEFAEATSGLYRFEKLLAVSDGAFAVRVRLREPKRRGRARPSRNQQA